MVFDLMGFEQETCNYHLKQGDHCRKVCLQSTFPQPQTRPFVQFLLHLPHILSRHFMIAVTIKPFSCSWTSH